MSELAVITLILKATELVGSKLFDAFEAHDLVGVEAELAVIARKALSLKIQQERREARRKKARSARKKT